MPDARDFEKRTEALFHAIAGGDEDALRVLYERYIRRLEAGARGRVPDRARGLFDTHTVAHEVLVNCLLRAQETQWQIAPFFGPYVHAALRNKLSKLRRDAGRRELVPLDDSFPSDEPSDLERLIEREFEAFVGAAVARLDPEARELLELRFEQDRPYRDIAERLGVPSEDAARMRVTRCVAVLRAHLETTDSGSA